MKFEVEKKSYKKGLVIVLSLILILGIVLVVRNSFAKYQSVKTIHIADGYVNYTVGDFSILAMYKNDGNEDIAIDRMPSEGYTINEEKSYCNINGTKDIDAKLYTNAYGGHEIKNIAKGSKCYLYFEKDIKSAKTLKKLKLTSKGKYNETDTFTGIATAADTGVYETEDDYGKSYYFRGLNDSLNNWVKFAGFYWRIIRINGNGSIRMIYSGIADGLPSSSNKTGETTQIGKSPYNHTYNDNAYVGYMMGIPLNGTETTKNTTSSNSTSYEKAHANSYDSDIKKKVDTWYGTNLAGYGAKLDREAGFCNDREINNTTLNYSGNGVGTSETGYASAGKFHSTGNFQTPSLKCANKERDLFTASSASTGNKKLLYPIGLITADEVVYAGGLGGMNNESYYLHTNKDYWTMSPFSYYSDGARVYHVRVWGGITVVYDVGASPGPGVRPVINLRSDVSITGTGSETDPYVVS